LETVYTDRKRCIQHCTWYSAVQTATDVRKIVDQLSIGLMKVDEHHAYTSMRYSALYLPLMQTSLLCEGSECNELLCVLVTLGGDSVVSPARRPVWCKTVLDLHRHVVCRLHLCRSVYYYKVHSWGVCDRRLTAGRQLI